MTTSEEGRINVWDQAQYKEVVQGMQSGEERTKTKVGFLIFFFFFLNYPE